MKYTTKSSGKRMEVSSNDPKFNGKSQNKNEKIEKFEDETKSKK